MELDLYRTRLDDPPGASRRWPSREEAIVAGLAQSLLQARHLIAIATIIVLIALVGSSPQL
ncbi:MAG: hypothetical protein U0838_05575 [Chloroflexota bacterium]